MTCGKRARFTKSSKLLGGDMTDAEIFNDFKGIEAKANATTRGADHAQIVRTLAAKYERTEQDISRLIIEHSVAGPC